MQTQVICVGATVNLVSPELNIKRAVVTIKKRKHKTAELYVSKHATIFQCNLASIMKFSIANAVYHTDLHICINQSKLMPPCTLLKNYPKSC